MRQTLFGTRDGRRYLWKRKLMIAAALVFLVWAFWTLREWYMYEKGCPPGQKDSLFANVFSLSLRDSFPNGNAIIQYVARLYLRRLLILLALGAVIFMIASGFPSYLSSAGISLSVFFAPYCLEKLGVSWMDSFSEVNYLAGRQLAADTADYIVLGICLVTAALAVPASAWLWQRETRITFD